MGLFNKKRPAPAPAAKPQATAKPVDPDDIWNTPSPARKRASDSVTSVAVKESKYDEPVPEKLEVESVDPEMIKTKMAQLEAEIAEKSSRPVKTHADYGTSTVGQEEIIDAQTEYEKLYEIEHERYVKSHYEDITKASEAGMAEKMEAMYAEHEAKVLADQTTEFEFSKVSQEEVDKKLASLPYALKPEEYDNYHDIASVKNEPDAAAIEQLGTIDHSEDPDDIGSVDDELLARKVQEFEQAYGDRRRSDDDQ
ncbi:MAG: hypothetical protein IJ806_03805 [Ruminococcus sp.]|nr:hypothetical protein [Ruminococcus sp.]